MDRPQKRRKFVSNILTGFTGGLLLGLPGISRAASKSNPGDLIGIPSGSFLMGTTKEQVSQLSFSHGYHPTWLSHESPQREVHLPTYSIDRYPVTNEQFHLFCQETGHSFPPHWMDAAPIKEIENHPVSYVNKADAMAYAKWAGKRLPTEAEWEKAARGSDGRLFPWGNEFNPDAICWNRSGKDELTTDPIDAHPEGASPYGVMDLSGNLFEWCSDGPADDSQLDRAVKHVAFLKGGAWISTEILDLRPAARGNSGHTSNKSAFYGFRCVK